eukprot:862262-Pelagomonas_calceolata.AAC.3
MPSHHPPGAFAWTVVTLIRHPPKPRDPPKPSPSMMTRDSSMMGSHRQSYRFPGFSSSRLSGASHFMPFTKDRTSPKAAKWQQ